MDKTTKTVEPDKTVPPATEAATFAASWDVFYQDAQGLECHLQLRGTSVDELLGLATGTSMAITEGGGKPSRRMSGAAHSGDKPKENGNGNGSASANANSNTNGNSNGNGSANGNTNANGSANDNTANDSFREPSYVDERGARRCNRKLSDGAICGRPVTEKEGRYGNFWSCPNYKSHAPVPAH